MDEHFVKKLPLLAFGVILGIAITFVWVRGWLPGANFAANQERLDIELSELFYRGGIAYAASIDPKKVG